jgi:dsRNA-specific ribonuclease
MIHKVFLSLVEYNALQQNLPHRFKRIRDDLHDTQQKKRPRLSSTINPNDTSSALSKNALMLLHELKPSIEYKLVAQTGPSHRPLFTMAVELNGQIFEGMAQTKKEAKQAGK